MAKILIVGSGVVGQATGKGFARRGHCVSYVDINLQTIAQLRAEGMVAMLPAEADWSTVDLVMLAVPTPTVEGQVVLDYIEAAALDVGRGLARSDRFVVVVVRSTVPPTTTDASTLISRPTPALACTSAKRIEFNTAASAVHAPSIVNTPNTTRGGCKPTSRAASGSDPAA